jgi:hypothetical protein
MWDVELLRNNILHFFYSTIQKRTLPIPNLMVAFKVEANVMNQIIASIYI